MPTFKYKQPTPPGNFVDMKQNSPTSPKKDLYYVGENEDVTGVSMVTPLGKQVSVEDYHQSRGAIEGNMGWKIVNKVTGGRYGRE